MKILVTGAKGFSSRYLIKLLKQSRGAELYFTDLQIGNEQNWYKCDLTEYPSVFKMMTAIKPDQVYNLAGTFSNDYEIDYKANVLAVKNILDCLLNSKLNFRVLLVGSSAEYGLVQEADNPIKETQKLNPVSIYGLTKVYQTFLMRSYRTMYDLDIVMVRPFNLLGRGMSEQLFVGRIEKVIRAYQAGEIKKIKVGNLEARRDYISISEAIEDYELVMTAGTSGEVYNVGKGSSIKMRDLLRDIMREYGMDMSIVEEIRAPLKNKMNVSEIYADTTKLKLLRRKSKRVHKFS
jgi:nucleoside-diphosphate-sugar epimerase